jgi:acyl-homoserine lactone synthase
MLHVITAKNRHGYVCEIDTMHRDRKRVFVDRLKWDLRVFDGEREVDQFDTDDAVYIVEASAGRHLASLRLLPTMKPHLLGEVFPFLCDGDVPREEDIWELTRLCITPDADKEEAGRLRGIVWLGALRYAFARGIRKFTGVTHAQFLSQVLAAGLNVEPLGLPQVYRGDLIGAHVVHISPDDAKREREKLRERAVSAGSSSFARSAG